MSKFDYSDLDGHLLQLLVAVVEVGSITGAAQRLGVTQSAVSHLLDKLRAITGDPLFVKSGRGIVATARAETGGAGARTAVQLERFATCSGEFDPAQLAHHLHHRRQRLPARPAAAAPHGAAARSRRRAWRCG
jgi:molybdenum-dependent DNA-binding transcriptional regulator ModE